jgi:adenosylcobinamide-GDP ribazoletransferase
MIPPVRVLPDQAETAPAAAAGERGLLSRSFDAFRAAMALLTRLPVPRAGAGAGAVAGAGAFAFVGTLLGTAAFVPLVVLGGAMPAVAAILAVAMLAILSGGLHLDGLADTFDALVAVGPDASERARRDPAVGAAGATALIVVVGLDVAALAGLAANDGAVFAGLVCVVAGSVSRLVPVLLARLTRTAAAKDGLGAWFVGQTRTRDVAAVIGTGLLVALLCGAIIGRVELAIGGAIGGVVSLGVGLWLVRLRGWLDGDLLGASVEIAFATTVLATAVLASWPQARI